MIVRGGRSGRVLALVLVLATGCAKKGPPTGGPPDIEPPRLVGSFPDSGAARVALDAHPSLTFSEGMEPRSSTDAVEIVPRIEIDQQRWSGRTLTLVPKQAFKTNTTYTLFLSPTARDRHGNAMTSGRAVVFTTADSMNPGVLGGKLEARGFKPQQTYLWCYDQAKGHRPDSTARDFDAVGLADVDGRFRVVGLAVPGQYRLWAFVDLNGNRSFEPGTDVLAPVDTTLTLTRAEPVLDGLQLRVVNPRAPAFVTGTVLDTLTGVPGDPLVIATCASDTTLRPRVEPVTSGAFRLELPGGTWRVRAFRDADRDRRYRPGVEAASEEIEMPLEAAAEVKD
ncbi:MAG TPA: Ig-like domain-containing protein, partial [Dongiaceae bacterium]|nr:Ig-like domain-containing protein [Dongiaceae bacterium]